MSPSRKRLTIRALLVVTGLFALDFAGIAWAVRNLRRGPRVGNLVMQGDVWVQVDWVREAFAPVVFFGLLVLLLFVLIYLYVPPRLDEVFAAVLALILFFGLIIPILQHW